jgi:uncharacterized membrane protein YqaE (UPF0057 family)
MAGSCFLFLGLFVPRGRVFRKRKRGILKSIAFCINSITIHTYIPTCMHALYCTCKNKVTWILEIRRRVEKKPEMAAWRGEGVHSRLLEDRQHAVRGIVQFLSMYHRRLKHGCIYITEKLQGVRHCTGPFHCSVIRLVRDLGPKGRLRALSSSTSSPKPSQTIPPTTRMHVLLSQYHHVHRLNIQGFRSHGDLTCFT